MKNKLLLYILLSTILLLTACKKDEPEMTENNYTGLETGPNYIVKSPVKLGAARGSIINNINNILDVKEIEEGLMELSKEEFPPEEYFVQEGQYLSGEMINKWVSRKSKENPEGFNPELKKGIDRMKAEKENPKVLSHILEQNYIDKDGKVGGISIALALNKVYYIKYLDKDGLTQNGKVTIDNKTLEAEGKKIATELIKRLRNNENVPQTPILITLYKIEENNSVKPGNFISKMVIGKNKIEGNWEKINRKYLTLTYNDVDNIKRLDNPTYQSFTLFYENVNKYFNNLDYKIYGLGLYENDTLTKLKIEIILGSITYPENVALTQHIGSQLESGVFPNHIPVIINVFDQEKVNKSLSIWDPIKKEVQSQIIQ